MTNINIPIGAIAPATVRIFRVVIRSPHDAIVRQQRWWDRLWSGGGSEIRKNEYNQYYYVKSEQGEMQNEVVVTYVYGKDGVKGNSGQMQNASASGIAIGATMGNAPNRELSK